MGFRQGTQEGFEAEDDEDFSTAEVEAAEQPAAKKRKTDLVGKSTPKDGAEDDEVRSPGGG